MFYSGRTDGYMGKQPEIVPLVVLNVSKRSFQKRSVAEALLMGRWVTDIGGSLSTRGLIQ